MSAPRSDWADKACAAAARVLPKYPTVEAALPELSRLCGHRLTANALRAALKVRGLPLPAQILGGSRWTGPKEVVETPEAPEEPPVSPLAAHVAKLEEKSLKRQHALLLEQLREAEERQRVLDALDRPLHVPVIKARERVSGLREATAVALASDWHVEERVFSEQVGGRNSYNLVIAEQRAHRFFEGVKWLVSNARNAFFVRDLILWLGGDLISGYIHEELEETNECSPIEAIIWLREVLCAGIDSLLADTSLERIVIPCSFGNHGRVHQRKRVKTGAQNSFEWLLYNWLQAHYAEQPRVHFVVDKSAHQYVQAYDWVTHYHHGDELKYAGGIGGVAIPINKRIPKWDRVKPAHFHNIGHFHTYMDLGRITTNGSLIGYSEYAMSFGGDYEPPQQAFYLLDSKRGKTMCSPIWVDEGAPVVEAA